MLRKLFTRRKYAKAAYKAIDLQRFMLKENFYDKDFFRYLERFVMQCNQYIDNNT